MSYLSTAPLGMSLVAFFQFGSGHLSCPDVWMATRVVAGVPCTSSRSGSRQMRSWFAADNDAESVGSTFSAKWAGANLDSSQPGAQGREKGRRPIVLLSGSTDYRAT